MFMATSAQPDLIHLSLLGVPIITCSGEPVVLPAKAIGLLAWLAEASPRPGELAIELFWPDRDPAAGR